MFSSLIPRGLLGRSLLLVILPIVLLQIVTTYAFYDRHWDSVTRKLARGLAGDIGVIVELLDQAATPEEEQQIFDMAARHMQMTVTFNPGENVSAITPPKAKFYSLLETILTRVFDDRFDRAYTIDSQSYDDQVEIRLQLDDGVLRVLAREKRLFSSTTYIFLTWMFVSSLVLIAIAVLFLRGQIRPIRLLARAAENFGKGRDMADFRPTGAREIRRAGGAFLVMKERIERQIRQRTEMLAGVSHDLRTPLTRMKLQLAMMPSNSDISDLKRDVTEMESMVSAYLDFARGQEAEAATLVELAKILRQIVKDSRRGGADVRLNCEPDVFIALRPVSFRRCVQNLIENAAKVATQIEIGGMRLPDAVIVTVDDNGPGIPAQRREEVFRAFRQLDEARNQDKGGGVGLGLTIARDVARQHGGEITLWESELGGLRAEIRLPV